MDTGRVIKTHTSVPEPKHPQREAREIPNPEPIEQPIPVPNWPTKKPAKVEEEVESRHENCIHL